MPYTKSVSQSMRNQKPSPLQREYSTCRQLLTAIDQGNLATIHFLTQGSDISRGLDYSLPTVMVLIELASETFKYWYEGRHRSTCTCSRISRSLRTRHCQYHMCPESRNLKMLQDVYTFLVGFYCISVRHVCQNLGIVKLVVPRILLTDRQCNLISACKL